MSVSNESGESRATSSKATAALVKRKRDIPLGDWVEYHRYQTFRNFADNQEQTFQQGCAVVGVTFAWFQNTDPYFPRSSFVYTWYTLREQRKPDSPDAE